MAARPDNGKSISILSSRRNKSFLLPPFAIILQPVESNTPRKTKIIETHHGKLEIVPPQAGQPGVVRVSLPVDSGISTAVAPD